MESSSSNLRNYEAVIIMHPDTAETEQKALFKKNQEIIKGFGGSLNHVDTWGKRKLANPIRKLNRGIYFHTTFQAKGDAIAELERTMKINERVLRVSHQKLDDRVSLAKHVERFKEGLAEAMNREKEREARAQARRAHASAQREGGHGMGGRRRDESFEAPEDESSEE